MQPSGKGKKIYAVVYVDDIEFRVEDFVRRLRGTALLPSAMQRMTALDRNEQ